MAKEAISFPVRCAHCQAEMHTAVVCEACNTLQPVAEQADAFELLQLPVTYRLDPYQLEDVYLRLSRMVHPDYFGQTASPERTLSEDLSARINNAYRTLKDPVQRSEFLLRRAGGKSATEDKAVAPDLLGEVLTLREEIEDARRENRTADLAALNDRLQQRSATAFEKLGQLHDELESAQSAGDDSRAQSLLDQIRRTLNGIRYLQGLLRESRT